MKDEDFKAFLIEQTEVVTQGANLIVNANLNPEKATLMKNNSAAISFRIYLCMRILGDALQVVRETEKRMGEDEETTAAMMRESDRLAFDIFKSSFAMATQVKKE